MNDPSTEGAEGLAGGGSALLRTAPVTTYIALTGLTVLLVLRGASLQVIIAPLASSFVFAFGLATGEPDVIFLAWLDQGTNLVLLEAESAWASTAVVTVSVVAILVLADLANMATASNPYGGVQSARQLRDNSPRFLLVGGVSCLLALGGLSLAPALAIPEDAVLAVSFLAVAALVAIAVLGSVEG